MLDAQAGVRPATLRVWRLRYGMTPWHTRSGANLYDLAELADVLGRRDAKVHPPAVTAPSHVDVLDAA